MLLKIIMAELIPIPTTTEENRAGYNEYQIKWPEKQNQTAVSVIQMC